MPAALTINWTEVRAAVASSGYQKAAETFGIKAGTIRQKAHREGWNVAAAAPATSQATTAAVAVPACDKPQDTKHEAPGHLTNTDATLEPDPTKLIPTPLETALHSQWMGKDVEMPALPWNESKKRSRARIEAFAAGTSDDVPSELDQWISELPAEWMVRFVLAVRVVGLISVACQRIKISHYILAKARDGCPAFAEAIKRAQDAAVDTVEGALFLSATVGDPEPVFDKGQHAGWKRRKSEKAADVLLRAKRPGEYRENQGQQTNVSIVLPSNEAIMLKLRELHAIEGGGAAIEDAGAEKTA